MRYHILTAAIGLVLAGLPLQSSAQETGYTFLSGATGPVVCLGKWVPSTDRALPGSCEGQLMDLGQFSAASARLSADRLDQVINILGSIDQRLNINNNGLQSLIEVASNLQRSIDKQASQDGLSEAIIKRFDAMPQEILSNDMFRQEIKKLKEDILQEVELRLSKKSPANPK